MTNSVQYPQKEKMGFTFFLYVLGFLMIMFDSVSLQYIESAPPTLFPFISVICMLPFFMTSPQSFIFNKKTGTLCVFVVICYIYKLYFCNYGFNFVPFLAIICGCMVMCADDDLKKKLLEITTKSLAVMLVISLIGWIPYLLHIPMSHYTEYDGTYYTFTYYKLFRINGYPYMSLAPRFMSFFMEPGHMATTCVFLLFANKINLKRWDTFILFISLLLSFSLAGYCLLLGAIGLKVLLYNKHRNITLIVFASFLALTTYIAIKVNNSDNVLYKVIISRLEPDEEKGIAGNNRYGPIFEHKFKKYLKTSDRYFGVGNLPTNKKWWIGNSGWKKFLVIYGFIGTFLIVLFYYKIARSEKSIACLCMFLLWFVTMMVRDHPLREYWLYIYIVSMPVLASYPLYKKQKDDK